MTRAERAALPYMHPGRVDVIGAGALVWRRIVERVAARPASPRSSRRSTTSSTASPARSSADGTPLPRSSTRVSGRALLWLVVAVGVAGGAAGTVVLTVPRLGDPTSKLGLQLVALTPLGLIAAIVLLGTAAIAAVLTRGRLRVLGLVLAALGALGVVAHLMWLAPLYVGTAPTAEPGPPLVVLTQNLEGADVNELAREVEARGVEVLVLSDVSEHQGLVVAATTIPRDLPHVLFTGGGPTVYSKYPMTEEVATSPDESAAVSRPFRSVQIATPSLGTIRLVAVHPAPPYHTAAWADDYRRTAGLLENRATADPLPTILAGDLNATLDHAPLRRIEALGYTDGVVQTNGGFRPTWPAPGSVRKFRVSVPPLVQIDHVMVSDQLVVTATSTVTIPESDHLGVLASVQRAAD